MANATYIPGYILVLYCKQAMTNKQTMSALIEIVEEAAAMGAEHSDLGLGVRQRLDEARAWDEEASRFFASCGRAPLIALEVRRKDNHFETASARALIMDSGLLCLNAISS